MSDSLDAEVRKTYREAERKLLPVPLLREREFYDNVWLLVGLVYCAPWIYFGYSAISALVHDEVWSVIWRTAIAIFFGLYHAHSAMRTRGLYYPLDIWEQSISRRRQEWRFQNPDKAAILDKAQNPLSYFM